MSDSFVIETADLRKRYDGVEALRGLTLAVPAGSICGFLGRTGSGKTTTIKVLLGMAAPTSGRATVFGLAADSPSASVQIRRRTGFVGDDKGLYDAMTVRGMVRYTASFYPKWSREMEEHYLRRFELPAARGIKTLSRGMRTKLAMLLALCRGADLLVLDEPTTGLDPAATEEVLQALVGHAADHGTTVFFSSHQLADVEQIADHVAIIDRGRIAVAGVLDDLRQNYRRIQLVFDGEAPDYTFQTKGVERVKRSGRVMTVLSSAGIDGVLGEARVLNPLSTDSAPVTLKDIFLDAVAVED
ncbi:MAG TPA: ABC transporter ATP-binding protein [Vicinamibacterales bacterium]|nr:ABC transporter ATP-binding protein [Vicinamibacterales bacterium]